MSSAPVVNLEDASLYLNREGSWLQFNRRVLEEAQDPSVPLLERLKFLAIFSSNLDEFFMVRVGGLMQKVQAGIERSSGADRTAPQEQLVRISDTVRELVAAQYDCWNRDVKPLLQRHNIVIRNIKDLTADDRRHLQEMFRSQIFPVLTPLAVDPGHPFPHLANKSLNLAVMLRRQGDSEGLFAVVQVPGVLSRMVQLPQSSAPVEVSPESATDVRLSGVLTPILPTSYALTPLEAAIRLHLGELFAGMEILDSVCFRVTRDSEFELDDEVEDLMRAIEENVKQRRRGHAVRLEIEADARPEVEQFLINALDLTANEIYRVPGKIDLTGLFQIHALPGLAELRDPPHVPVLPRDLSGTGSMWSAIRSKDILMHHPYETFKSVVDFIETAADDDRVLAIKQTLYRTSSDSPIVKALQRAADRGKQVTAVIELKARLDEERNILWAKELEKAGVHVVFGFVGLKTHCKVALVVRREDDGIRRYVHLGTGNYNPTTARIYTDLGFFTANPDFADDVTLLFNHLTGYAEPPRYRKLVVAPRQMQPFMIEMIDREAASLCKNQRPVRAESRAGALSSQPGRGED
jgi:polyphosphate kinase